MTTLVDGVDRLRRVVSDEVQRAGRSALGQFFTPAATARLVAGMTSTQGDMVRVLDPGAGIGILSAAWIARVCALDERPRSIHLTAFELDPRLMPTLEETLEACADACRAAGIDFTYVLRNEDFIEGAVRALDSSLFAADTMRFDLAILNPPYLKLRADSRPRQLLRRLGLEVGNLYTAFFALSVSLLAEGGEVVAIVPRSFCNGPYFLPFRKHLLSTVALRRIHVFARRDSAFRDDRVLQENVIVHGKRGGDNDRTVCISTSDGTDDSPVDSHEVSYDEVVRPGDGQMFIHLAGNAAASDLATSMLGLPNVLDDLGLRVSTGRVVEFRARQWIEPTLVEGSVPLLHPTHLRGGEIVWPKEGGKKPNAIRRTAESESLLVPRGRYVVVKRFSSKEERRRIVAALVEPDAFPLEAIGMENHLNYYHARHGELDLFLARGLVLFLNSTHVDAFFRQFNGHTQVNATDLRSLRYPSAGQLRRLGEEMALPLPAQETIDRLVERVLDLSKRSE